MDELSGLVEYAPTPVLVADGSGEVTRVNDLAETLLGRDANALVGRALDDLLTTTGSMNLCDSLAGVRAAGGPRHLGADAEVHVNGPGDGGQDRPVPVDLRVDVAHPADAAERFVLALTEVSTRERRLSELRASEERYRRLLEVSPAPIAIYDEEGVIRYANGAAADLVGAPDSSAMVGRSAIEYVHPDERADSRTLIAAAVEEREVIETVERRLVTTDGETRHTVLSSVPVTYEDEPAVQVVLSDVTALVERERTLARQNEHLDRFASIVSHDLRNPLAVLRSSLELAAETDDPEHVERGLDAVDRMEELVEDLLALARRGERPTEREQLPLADVAAAAWRTVETGDADLAVQADGTVVGDEVRLRELLENLFHNAVEHGGEDVSITVGQLPDGFAVADDGCGVTPDERDAVFESGYTTDDDGTGLGLAIVREIAEAHGWTVELTESEAGGARFEFTTA